MPKYKIEHSVPLPATSIYPFDAMEKGDSFFISTSNIKLTRNRVGAAACKFASKYMGVKFTVHAVPGGVRVWRIK